MIINIYFYFNRTKPEYILQNELKEKQGMIDIVIRRTMYK